LRPPREDHREWKPIEEHAFDWQPEPHARMVHGPAIGAWNESIRAGYADHTDQAIVFAERVPQGL
jgi:hypothetical protein